MSVACKDCGCSEDAACLEFDERGFAHACYWVTSDCCSACFFHQHVEPPEFDEGVDTRIRRKGKKRLYLQVPELAGMVARPRRDL